jgi:hypothetical protein
MRPVSDHFDPTDEFLGTFAAYRYDEVCGDWKPYRQIIRDALRRALARHGLAYREAEANRIYDAIGTCGPHPDVPAGLARLASRYRLVILSNAADDQITSLGWGRPFTPSTRPSRRGPTSHAWPPSSEIASIGELPSLSGCDTPPSEAGGGRGISRVTM